MLNNYKNMLIMFLSLFIVGSMYVMQLRMDSVKSRFSECSLKIENQNASIGFMQKTMNDKLIRERLAEEGAAKKAANYQSNIDELTESYNPPKDCEGAMKWLISKGREMR
jgi:cell division protein FtsL